MAISPTYTVKCQSNQPLPPCLYNQIAWIGTPTTFTGFAKVQVAIFKTRVVANIHFTTSFPEFVETYKTPGDLAVEETKAFVQKYGEEYNLTVKGQFTTPMAYDVTLSKEEKQALVSRNTGEEQFLTVTELEQIIFNAADDRVEEKQLSQDERSLLETITCTFNKRFPNLKK